MLLVFIAAITHCWLRLPTSSPGPPAPFQQSCCPVSQFPACPVAKFSLQCLPDIAFVLVEFNDVAAGPLLQPVYVLLNGNPALECVIEMEADRHR